MENEATKEKTPVNCLSNFRVSKIKQLEQQNLELIRKIKQLENFCGELRDNNIRLAAENEKLKLYLPRDGNTEEHNEQVYQTDEEMLAQETNWNVKKNKKNKRASKKRKVKSSVEIDVNCSQNQALGNSEYLPENGNDNENSEQVYQTDEEVLAKETEWILKKNKKKTKKFNTKAIDAEPVQTQSQINPKNVRPPPVMVSGLSKFNELHSLVKKTVKQEFTIKIVNNHTYKINTFNSDDYREITKIFNEKKLIWHTFEDKQNRPIRVILKNLHHTCETSDIINDLKSQGYNIISATNKFKYRTKDPLDMFILSFDSSETINRIYEINKILNTIVNIEPIRLPKDIAQCKNCQSFNHTKNYCSKQTRCVKCAGNHDSKLCNKPPNVKPKCCNCGDSHPASYRGCVVAKELQRLKNIKTKKIQSNIQKSSNASQRNNNRARERIEKPPQNLYSEAVKKNTPITRGNKVLKSLEKADNKNQDILGKILNKLENLEKFNSAIEQRLLTLEENFNSIID